MEEVNYLEIARESILREQKLPSEEVRSRALLLFIQHNNLIALSGSLYNSSDYDKTMATRFKNASIWILVFASTLGLALFIFMSAFNLHSSWFFAVSIVCTSLFIVGYFASVAYDYYVIFTKEPKMTVKEARRCVLDSDTSFKEGS